MSRCAYLVLLMLGLGLVVPVMIGASCPPPQNVPYLDVSTSPSGSQGALPQCEPDRVCVSIVNKTCLDVEVQLYTQDGYDLAGDYILRTATECCENPSTAPGPCPCDRDGSTEGEMQLLEGELFDLINITSLAGSDDPLELRGRTSRSVSQGAGIIESFRCTAIKNIGVEVAPIGDLPVSYEDREGPDYRCAMTAVDYTDPPRPEDVACGETIQYVVADRNDCIDPDFTILRLNTEVSGGCQAGTR